MSFRGHRERGNSGRRDGGRPAWAIREGRKEEVGLELDYKDWGGVIGDIFQMAHRIFFLKIVGTKEGTSQVRGRSKLTSTDEAWRKHTPRVSYLQPEL